MYNNAASDDGTCEASTEPLSLYLDGHTDAMRMRMEGIAAGRCGAYQMLTVLDVFPKAQGLLDLRRVLEAAVLC